MKLNEIRTFVAVAEAQSVQEAGNRLGLTQSAVSRLIQRLEAELGVILFDRQTKPLALTRDGALALAHARRVLAATEELSDAFTGAAQPRGLLRFGVSHVLTSVAALQPLDRLRAAFPGLTVRLHSDWSTPLMERVRNGTLDGALLLLSDDQTPHEDLTAQRLSREPVSIIASPAMAARGPWTLPAMNEVGWLLQPDGCKYRASLTQALSRHGLSPNVTVEAYDQTLLVSLVARGVGFGLAPMRLIEPIPHIERVCAITAPEHTLTVAVWLVRARLSSRVGPVFDLLEDSLLEQLGKRTAFDTARPPLHSAAE